MKSLSKVPWIWGGRSEAPGCLGTDLPSPVAPGRSVLPSPVAWNRALGKQKLFPSTNTKGFPALFFVTKNRFSTNKAYGRAVCGLRDTAQQVL